MPEELSRWVLLIQETEGRVSHSWQPVAGLQKGLHQATSSFQGITPSGAVVIASGRRRDCDQEHVDCHRECMRRKLPAPYEHVPRGSPSHNEICRGRCLTAYEDCVEAERVRGALRFPAVNGAVEWLKTHREQVLVGTVIVIAGVTFVVVSAGVGLVILAPVVLLASSDGMDSRSCAEGTVHAPR